MGKLLSAPGLWLVAALALLVVVALAASATGTGPLAFLHGRGAGWVSPLFAAGALVAAVASFRQFVSGFDERPTTARLLLGFCIGVVGAASWALVAFSLIYALAAPGGRP